MSEGISTERLQEMADPRWRFISPEVRSALEELLERRELAERWDTATVLERVAQMTAHRACHAAEHDPANGKIHGFCIVCGVPWPCDYVGLAPVGS